MTVYHYLAADSGTIGCRVDLQRAGSRKDRTCPSSTISRGPSATRPLVRIRKLIRSKATVLAKMESLNPLASVKDRIGLAMIEAAERSGQDQGKARPSSSPPAATRASPWPSSAPSRGYRLHR